MAKEKVSVEIVVSPEEPKDPQPLLPHKIAACRAVLSNFAKIERPNGLPIRNSDQQQRRISPAENFRSNVVREAWTNPIDQPKNRSRWIEQTPIDANVFSQMTPMENSDGLSTEKKNENETDFFLRLVSIKSTHRPQWSNSPRGTILSILERAPTQDRSMSSINDQREILDSTLLSKNTT